MAVVTNNNFDFCSISIQETYLGVPLQLNRLRMDDLLEFNSYFTFNYNNTINGPLLATAVGLEIILALITNLFVLIFDCAIYSACYQYYNITDNDVI